MLRLLGNILPNPVVAVSGGVDSMAALSFIRNNPRNNPTVAFFDHGTEASGLARTFLTDYCDKQKLRLTIGSIERDRTAEESPEEYWRNERYRFFKSLNVEVIVQGHHLGDQVEQWLFTSMHGAGRLIPYRNGNIIRPFLMVCKTDLRDWCERKSVPWIEDKSNADLRYARNRIRHCIVPEALKINPGLATVIMKKVAKEYNDDTQ